MQHAVTSRPLFLLLDGHSSHYTLDLIQTAADNDVVIFCLPPHTTADSQPLDTSCFGPLKVYWSEACRLFMFANPGCVVSKFQFSSLFSQAWSKGMTINNVVSGFRSTGIYPFDRNAVLSKLPTSAEASTLSSGGETSSGSDHLSDEETIDGEDPASDHPVPVTHPAR